MKEQKEKPSIFTKLDMFGVQFNFLINRRNKHQTLPGAFLTITLFLGFVVLFFGFGVDLYQRKSPKVSMTTAVLNNLESKLSNKNFTYAYRIEDTYNKLINDTSKIFLEPMTFKYDLIDHQMTLTQGIKLVPKRCYDLPFTKEKEILYNVSLQDWYCLDFDNITLGGDWSSNFVYGILINTRHCSNATDGVPCINSNHLDEFFENQFTSSNVFYSDLSTLVLPAMDNYENPLLSTLVNKYEMLHPLITKRSILTLQTTQISNDLGWFFNDINFESYISNDNTQPDFTLKDKNNQDILFSQFIYLGKKIQTYSRSYIKVQEVLASIGGFAKFFYFFVTIIYNFNINTYKNIILMNNIDLEEFESKNERKLLLNSSINNSNTIKSIKTDGIIPLNIINKVSMKSITRQNENQEKDENQMDTHKINLKKIGYCNYFIIKVCCKNNNVNRNLKNYTLLREYFENNMDISNYLKLTDDFNILKKIIQESEDRSGFGVIKKRAFDFSKSYLENSNLGLNQNLNNTLSNLNQINPSGAINNLNNKAKIQKFRTKAYIGENKFKVK